MKAIANITLIPLGAGISLSPYVAQCVSLHANGTNVEGEMDTIFDAVIHEKGAPRIHTQISIGTRIDKDSTMEDKIKSVKEKLDL